MPSETAKTKAKLGMWAYVLLYNFVGDIITKDTNSKIHMALDMAKGTMDNASSPEKEKALKAKENIDTISTGPMLAGTGSNRNPVEAGRNLAKFIIYGTNIGTKLSTFESPGFVVVSTKEEKATDRSFKIIARDPGEWSHPMTISDYQGVEKESNCAVRQKVYGENAIGCSDSTSFPVLIEDIDYFVKVIKNSPTAKQEQLIQALVKFNEYKMAIGLINNMFEVLKDANTVPPFMKKQSTGTLSDSNTKVSPTKGYGVKEQHAFMDKAGKTLFEAEKTIEKLTGGFTEYGRIISIFKNQEMENRSRGMKNTIK